jgi:hypothetical protein
VLKGGFQEVFHKHKAGIVDEDVDGAEKFQGLASEQARPLYGRQVGHNAQTAATFADDNLAGGFEAGGITTGDNEVGAGIGEDSSDFSAKPAGGAGDQGALVGEAEARYVVRHGVVGVGVGFAVRSGGAALPQLPHFTPHLPRPQPQRPGIEKGFGAAGQGHRQQQTQQFAQAQQAADAGADRQADQQPGGLQADDAAHQAGLDDLIDHLADGDCRGQHLQALAGIFEGQQ